MSGVIQMHFKKRLFKIIHSNPPILYNGFNSFTTEFQFPNFPYLYGIKCRKLGENRGYIGKAL